MFLQEQSSYGISFSALVNNTNKRLLFTIKLINYTIFLPKDRELKKRDNFYIRPHQFDL